MSNNTLLLVLKCSLFALLITSTVASQSIPDAAENLDALSSFGQYYNVFSPDEFPPLERERILNAVLQASSFEEALEIVSQIVDVYILDEEAHTYGEKYVMPSRIKKLLNKSFPGWTRNASLAQFAIVGDLKFIVLKNTQRDPFGALVHELIHRLLFFRTTVNDNIINFDNIPITTLSVLATQQNPKEISQKINKLVGAIEEFVIFSIERTHWKSYRVSERICPNHDEFQNLREAIMQLESEHNFDKASIKKIILTTIEIAQALLPHSLPKGNPIAVGIERAELHIFMWPVSEPIYDQINAAIGELKIALIDIGFDEFDEFSAPSDSSRISDAVKREGERVGFARERRALETSAESIDRSGRKRRKSLEIQFRTLKKEHFHR